MRFSMGAEKTIYSKGRGLILAFHGTDEKIVRDVVLQSKELSPSNNRWDWIGHGIYFWEQSYSRAMEFARAASRRKNSQITKPAVIGAVLDLGYCLDLLDYGNAKLLKEAFIQIQYEGGPHARETNKSASSGDDLLLRFLDCAVIETLHDMNRQRNQPPFDSVRAVFWEGPPLYPTAGFREKNHIQICIRNPNCIKGLFMPRKHSEFKA